MQMSISTAAIADFWAQLKVYDDNYGHFSDSCLNGQMKVHSLLKVQLDNPDHPVRRVLVVGKAGTGKSSLINAMCKTIDKERGFLPVKRHQSLSYTNAAARIIQGKTIHEFLSIPFNCRKLVQLSGDKLQKLQLRLKHVQFILIDNLSLIGIRLFEQVNERLREARGSSQEFGGYFIYFFGDPIQLQPVQDEPKWWLCSPFFQRMFELNSVHRQAWDEDKFKRLLERLHRGERLGFEERQLLEGRHVDQLPRNLVDSFLDELHLFPFNKQVADHNKRLQASKERLGLTVTVKTANIDRNGRKIEIAIWQGCRVMLTDDICVDRGLGKHSMGVVKEIIELGSSHVLLIQFENYTGLSINGLVPIEEVLSGGLPIMLAQGMTIHKAQGMHLGRVVVNYRNGRENWPGMTYVAMSRVSRIGHILITGMIPR